MRRAFTLIEVLVVIAIMALLISILLPALGGARTAGHQIKALSNARTVGQSFGHYLNDYDQTYPFIEPFTSDDFPGGGSLLWFQWYPETVRIGVGPPFGVMAWAWPAAIKEISPWEENYQTWVSPGMDTTLPKDIDGGAMDHDFAEDISWRYSNAFVSDPKLWSGNAPNDPSLYRAVHEYEVTGTSGKVLLWDTHLAYLRDEPKMVEGHWDALTPMAFADFHAEAKNPLDAAEGVFNPLTGSSTRLHNTPDGVRGMDY